MIMEDERLSYLDDESRYYIYIGHDKRIIKIQEFNQWYIPIREFKFLIFNGKINPIVFINPHDFTIINNEIIYKPNCPFNVLQECKEQALELIIWERFEKFIFDYTKIYAKNYIEILNDIYILDEIKIYDNTGEVGPLLQNIHSLNEYNYSISDIIDKEKLIIEDKKNILLFINTQRHNLKKLISEKKYEDALSYIKKTHGSW